MITRKERKERAKLKIAEIKSKIAKEMEYMVTNSQSLTYDGFGRELANYAEGLARKNPQENHIIDRALDEFLDDIGPIVKNNKLLGVSEHEQIKRAVIDNMIKSLKV